MKIAIKDANVFIDLESMGLLDLWFQLGIPTLTSDFVVTELEAGAHSNALASIRAGQVTVAQISGAEMAGVFSEFLESHAHKGLSDTDLSVVYLAIREQAMVLSGDRLLRSVAEAETLEIHGTLWILDQLVESSLLRPHVAADRLDALMRRTGKEQRYLPKGECNSRINKWRK